MLRIALKGRGTLVPVSCEKNRLHDEELGHLLRSSFSVRIII
jgi:hypothetical protein